MDTDRIIIELTPNPIIEYLQKGFISDEMHQKIGEDEDISESSFDYLCLKITKLIRDVFESLEWDVAHFNDYFISRSKTYVQLKNKEFIQAEFNINSKSVGWSVINSLIEKENNSILRDGKIYDQIKKIYGDVMPIDGFVCKDISDKPLFDKINSFSQRIDQQGYLLTTEQESSDSATSALDLDLNPTQFLSIASDIRDYLQIISRNLAENQKPIFSQEVNSSPSLPIQTDTEQDDSDITFNSSPLDGPGPSLEAELKVEKIPLELIKSSKRGFDEYFALSMNLLSEHLNSIAAKSTLNRVKKDIETDIATIQTNLSIVIKGLSNKNDRFKEADYSSAKQFLAELKTQKEALKAELADLEVSPLLPQSTTSALNDFLTSLAKKPSNTSSTEIKSRLQSIQKNQILLDENIKKLSQRISILNRLKTVKSTIKRTKAEALESNPTLNLKDKLNVGKGWLDPKVELKKPDIQSMSEALNGQLTKYSVAANPITPTRATKLLVRSFIEDSLAWQPNLKTKEKQDILNAVDCLVDVFDKYHKQINEKYKLTEILSDLASFLEKLEKEPSTIVKEEERRQAALTTDLNNLLSKIFNENLEVFHPIFHQFLAPILNPENATIAKTD